MVAGVILFLWIRARNHTESNAPPERADLLRLYLALSPTEYTNKEGVIMLFINDFLGNHSELIDKPITEGKKQGFRLLNGVRIFFKEWRLTTQNRAKLARLYKERGIK
jgi:hypothetical protein